jgi:hypothetical protein
MQAESLRPPGLQIRSVVLDIPRPVSKRARRGEQTLPVRRSTARHGPRSHVSATMPVSFCMPWIAMHSGFV